MSRLNGDQKIIQVIGKESSIKYLEDRTREAYIYCISNIGDEKERNYLLHNNDEQLKSVIDKVKENYLTRVNEVQLSRPGVEFTPVLILIGVELLFVRNDNRPSHYDIQYTGNIGIIPSMDPAAYKIANVHLNVVDM
jgi:hypothetical protein